MNKSVIRILLVIGENHEEIAKKYSLDTVVEPYVRYKYDDAGKLRKSHLNMLDKVLTSKELNLTKTQKEVYREMYLTIKDMDDFEYYQYITQGLKYDEKTGDALSTENPEAHYQYERCYQDKLENGEEGWLSTPFPLIDGGKSYIAKVGDIAWSEIHLNPEAVDLYGCAWDLIVDYIPPKKFEDETDDNFKIREEEYNNTWIYSVAEKNNIEPEQAKSIFTNMLNKSNYFNNFEDRDEYIKHSTSFWTYAVASKDKYESVTHKVSDKEWVRDFYKKFISKLPEDETIAIYEIKILE